MPELADILQKPQYAISKASRYLMLVGLLEEKRIGKLVFCFPPNQTDLTLLARYVQENSIKEPEMLVDLNRLNWRLGLRENGKVTLNYQDTPAALRVRPRVLFVCVHNSARSQLAEEYLRSLAKNEIDVESAGITPGKLNPWVVKHLAKKGINISQKITRGVSEIYKAGKTFDWVITVCSPEAEKDCPIFPEPVRRLSWPFEDPSNWKGKDSEINKRIDQLASQIQSKVKDFYMTLKQKETA